MKGDNEFDAGNGRLAMFSTVPNDVSRMRALVCRSSFAATSSGPAKPDEILTDALIHAETAANDRGLTGAKCLRQFGR